MPFIFSQEAGFLGRVWEEEEADEADDDSDGAFDEEDPWFARQYTVQPDNE